MGFDLDGKKPLSDAGKEFRNNSWWWRPLWGYCEQVAPDLTSKVVYGQSNDGDGLNGKDSKDLAARLREEISSGRCAKFAAEYEAERKAIPPERCQWCHGTGKRKDAVARANVAQMEACHGCNGCGGKGVSESFDAAYPFSEENVKEFADFLNDCGGFEIW